jgi:hypothetical protein
MPRKARKKLSALEKLQQTEEKFVRSIQDMRTFLQLHPYLNHFAFHLNRPELSEYVGSLRFKRVAQRDVVQNWSSRTYRERFTCFMLWFDFEKPGLVKINYWIAPNHYNWIRRELRVDDKLGVHQLLLECQYWTAHEAAQIIVEHPESEAQLLPEGGKQ